MQTLTGWDAIEHARTHAHCALAKYADPTEGARNGLRLEEAEDIAREDPSLIHLTCDDAPTIPEGEPCPTEPGLTAWGTPRQSYHQHAGTIPAGCQYI